MATVLGEQEEKTTSHIEQTSLAVAGEPAAGEASRSQQPPLLVFLNGASGGRMGLAVMEELGKLLPQAQ